MEPVAHEPSPLGEVDVDGTVYLIFASGIERYHVVRRSDGHRIGGFRGSPNSMWLLEPSEVDIDFLRRIVRTAIVEGVLGDTPTD
jgi:hypothetical protein